MKIDQFQPYINDIIKFLKEIYNSGIGYTSVCMGLTAINTIVMLSGFPDISEHTLIKRFIKVPFNTKPSKPRYTYTWDINKVLSYIASLECNETLSNKIISQNLVILLLLVNCLSIQHMEADENSYTFIPIELQKHSRPSHCDMPKRFIVYKD